MHHYIPSTSARLHVFPQSPHINRTSTCSIQRPWSCDSTWDVVRDGRNSAFSNLTQHTNPHPNDVSSSMPDLRPPLLLTTTVFSSCALLPLLPTIRPHPFLFHSPLSSFSSSPIIPRTKSTVHPYNFSTPSLNPSRFLFILRSDSPGCFTNRRTSRPSLSAAGTSNRISSPSPSQPHSVGQSTQVPPEMSVEDLAERRACCRSNKLLQVREDLVPRHLSLLLLSVPFPPRWLETRYSPRRPPSCRLPPSRRRKSAVESLLIWMKCSDQHFRSLCRKADVSTSTPDAWQTGGACVPGRRRSIPGASFDQIDVVREIDSLPAEKSGLQCADCLFALSARLWRGVGVGVTRGRGVQVSYGLRHCYLVARHHERRQKAD
ncbi:hypothetical protein BAUCODRAFT_226319 [Baudoinia panamericana UAMH 10762]|uniref:Uncharacterized protein n=1 Tax=Baudoinia panamericana (strain UAMH 10762) TaxID=717646 RepID=M2N625_BAUPA|nr:uncharacterized protein BAUCODRAFT_226319 [Baudoinia panamericana UAMH 10762]EMC94235.1 hypothetical protein BAUCODRAFT_226319 [Baudoinia panamericana UAMH 10762]